MMKHTGPCEVHHCFLCRRRTACRRLDRICYVTFSSRADCPTQAIQTKKRKLPQAASTTCGSFPCISSS